MSSSREIKVRFWYKGRAGMTSHVYTLGEILNGDPFEDYCDNKLADWRMMFERDEWTGLADKNGREIYEGDIVQDISGEVLCVKWSPPYFALYRDGLVKGSSYETHFCDFSGEVIGNIHENPNLLKGKV